MNWFKLQVTLTDTETDELAIKTELSPSKITLWFQKQQRLMRSMTVNKILKNLSLNWHFSWLIYLEQCYRKCVTITPVEAAELSHRWNTTDAVIFGWFRRRRLYELFKFQGVRQTVAEEHRGIHDVLEAKDLNVMIAALSKAEISHFVDPDSHPSVIVHRCRLLVGRYMLDQDEDSSPEQPKMIERDSSLELDKNKPRPGIRRLFTPEQRAFLQDRFTNNEYISVKEAEDIAVCKFNGTVHRKMVLNWFKNARQRKKLAAKIEPPIVSKRTASLLKSEYLRDPNITDERIAALARHVRMKIDRIRKWFTFNFPSSNLGGKMERDSDVCERRRRSPVQKCKSSSLRLHHSRSQLQMLFQTFKSFPHPSPSCIAELSSRANLTQAQVRLWFQAKRRKLSLVSNDILLGSYRNRSLKDEQMEALEAEFQKHPFESAETRETLATQLKLKKALIMRWFSERRLYELKSSTMQTMNLSAHADPSNSSVDAESDASDHPNVELDTFDGCQVVTDGSNNHKNLVDAFPNFKIVKVGSARACADVLADFSCNCIEAKTCGSVSIQPRKQPKNSLSESLEHTEYYGVGENLTSSLSPEMKIDSQFTGQNAETHRKTSTLPDVSASRASLTNACAVAAKSTLEFPKKLAKPGESTRASQTSVEPNAEGPNYLLKSLADSSEPLPDYFRLAAHDVPPSRPELPVDDPLKSLSDNVDGDALPAESRTEVTSSFTAVQSAANLPKPVEETPAKCTRKKKKEHYFSQQMRILRHEFRKCPFPSSSKIRLLSRDLNFSARRIEAWFQKKRSKWLQSLGSSMEKSERVTSRSLTPWQLFVLDQEYGRNSQLTEERVKDLCRRLRISRQPIVTWFMERNGEKNLN